MFNPEDSHFRLKKVCYSEHKQNMTSYLRDFGPCLVRCMLRVVWAFAGKLKQHSVGAYYAEKTQHIAFNYQHFHEMEGR